jgi:CheY-like chemotaxis protein
VGSKVLVVDDEADLRFLLRRRFEKAGHEVSEAGNGATALRSVLSAHPDLVVTDLTMPVMDGYELIRRLKADPATADILILSVSGNMRLPSGADAAMAKPYHWKELMAMAEGLLYDGSGEAR